MKPASPSGGRDKRAAPQPSAKKTPNTDMQDEDVGTTDSSSAHEGDSATAATRAMKQTSKTTAESGNKKQKR